jgi:hypothetical protein
MKNRVIVFFAQLIYNIGQTMFLKYIDEGFIAKTLVSEFVLCFITFTVMKKIIEDKNDKYLFWFYSIGCIIGTGISMKLFEVIN